MLLRVGTDGSSSKIDVQDWEATEANQFAECGPTPCNNFDTTVQTGSVPNIQYYPYGLQAQMITNADQGVLLSWEADTGGYCASASYGVCSSQVPVASTFGLATTSGGGIASSATVTFPAKRASFIQYCRRRMVRLSALWEWGLLQAA